MDFFQFFVSRVVQYLQEFLKWVMRKLCKAIVRPNQFLNLNSICKNIPLSPPPFCSPSIPLTFAPLLPPPFNPPLKHPHTWTPPEHPHLRTPAEHPPPPTWKPPEPTAFPTWNPPPPSKRWGGGGNGRRITFLSNIKSNKNIKLRQEKTKLNNM